MNLSVWDWHQRFTIQARWTSELRRHLYRRVEVTDKSRILEVGCGTGALLADFSAQFTSPNGLFGLDLKADYLSFVSSHTPRTHLVQADAHHAPYARASFDLVFCHFLLLWVQDPSGLVAEMRRLARPGSCVFALAEPDYGGRIDYPDNLAQLGIWQEESLHNQGADTRIGRRLAEIFQQAGLQEIEVGILGGQWQYPIEMNSWKSEWKIIHRDLGDFVPAEKLASLQESDLNAYHNGSRLLYVPTFYAQGLA